MKKNIAAIVLAIVIIAVAVYLLLKTWDVFGFWTIFLTGIAQVISYWYFFQIGCRKERDKIITYNPLEWPKFVHIGNSVFIGYYLYDIISWPGLDRYDYIFGLSYLILFTGIPTVFAIYRLIRDRNDYVKIDDETINFKDNSTIGSFDIRKILKVDIVSEDLNLVLIDESVHTIRLSKMNFNLKDRSSLLEDIKQKLPKSDDNTN